MDVRPATVCATRSCMGEACGYSLLELLVALSIAALLAALGISGFSTLASKTQQRNAVQQLLSTIERARHLAITIHGRTLVCMMDIEGRCTSDWQGVELSIVPDKNNNRKQDTGEAPIYRQPWQAAGIHITWANWLSDSSITYQADGSVASNGTLTLYDSNSAAFAALVISKSGRVRLAPQS